MKDRLIEAFGWVACAIVFTTIAMLVFGTPYLRTGPLYCLNDGHGHCAPPAMCTYVGLQGRRHVSFGDATDCPAIALLPLRDGRSGQRF